MDPMHALPIAAIATPTGGLAWADTGEPLVVAAPVSDQVSARRCEGLLDIRELSFELGPSSTCVAQTGVYLYRQGAALGRVEFHRPKPGEKAQNWRGTGLTALSAA